MLQHLTRHSSDRIYALCIQIILYVCKTVLVSIPKVKNNNIGILSKLVLCGSFLCARTLDRNGSF